MASVRLQIVASDGRTAPNGSPYFYDSGWQNQTLASGSSSSFTVQNAYTAGIPCDTGSGSADPSLHLVAIISASIQAGGGGNFANGSSAAFDIQWGIPSIQWNPQPPTLVTTAQASITWAFTDSRGNAQGSYEIFLESLDGQTLYYDSGQTQGSGHGPMNVNYNLLPNTSYRIVLEAWNSNGIPSPTISTIVVGGTTRVSTIPIGGPLRRFLAMLAFQLDTSRTLAEQLRNVNNPMLCPGSFLPALAQELGVHYEADMGMTQTRKLLATIVHQYKIKGTYPGIAGISEAITGWPAKVTMDATTAGQVDISLQADRTNLMVNPSFENNSSTGWTNTTNCSIAPTTTVAYQNPGIPSPGSHSLAVTATAAGNMTVTSAAMSVEAALLYTASAYAYPGSTAREVYASIMVEGSTGNLLSERDGSQVREVAGEWVRPIAQIDPTNPMPSNTSQVTVEVTWVGCAAGEIHYLDAVLFEEGWAVRPYFDAGSFAGSQTAGDYLWQGSNEIGPSYYYRNLTNKLARLKAVLAGAPITDFGQQSPLSVTGFIPMGLTFALFTGNGSNPVTGSANLT